MKKTIKKAIKRLFQSEEEIRHSLVGPSHLWKMKRDFQFNFLKQSGILPHHKLLDIGCGTLRGGIPIIEYLNEGNYWGIEVRADVIAEGRNELLLNQLEYKKPNLISFSDFGDLKFDIKFDIMFAFSVLIHMEDEITKKCIKFVADNIKSSGLFYANVNTEKYPDANWQGFPIVFRSLEFYEELAHSNDLIVSNLGPLEKLGHISGQELADKQLMFEFRNKR